MEIFVYIPKSNAREHPFKENVRSANIFKMYVVKKVKYEKSQTFCLNNKKKKIIMFKE